MNEMNISDELISKFLEGKTDEVEEARLLMAMEADGMTVDDLAAIAAAAKMADSVPHKAPDLDLAKKQIADTLKRNDKKENTIPTVRPSKKRVIWAMAASIAIVLAVALFVHFRPDGSGQNFAQDGADSTAVTATCPQQEKNLAQASESKDNPVSKSRETNSVETDEDPVAQKETPYASQIIEKRYAQTATANSLSVIKPNKDNYRVNCKNLERSFNFEWSATNVQKLHFTVTNSQGKVIANILDKTTEIYSLKYIDIYPERQLKWTLTVGFEDGTSETKSGQIQIDYNLNAQ